MNVLILNPPVLDRLKYIREGRCEQRLSSFQYVMVPISLPYIAGLLLKHEFNVRVLDSVAEEVDLDCLVDEINKFKPELIVFNISTATYRNDINVVRILKREKGIKSFFAGIGVHVTSLADDVLRESDLDAVVRGEPEHVVLSLAESIDKKASLGTVDGLTYREGDAIRCNDDQAWHENLDEMPFPARNLIKNELYTLPVINEPYTLLVPSRGCPHKCIFCTAHKYYGRRVRYRSVDSIVDELKEIVYVNKVHNVTMWADTFTLRKDFVIEICKRIIDEKIPVKWFCNSRVDTVDPEMLGWMAKSGCRGISYGIESGVQDILDNVKKGITLQQIRDAIKWTNEAGIESLAHVIFGLPGETKDTMATTIEFIKDIRPTYAQFYCAVPFPGTEFLSIAKEKGWLISEDWDLFEINRAIISTPDLPVEELEKIRKTAYIKFYFRPSYMWERFLDIKTFRDFCLSLKQFSHFIYTWVIKPA